MTAATLAAESVMAMEKLAFEIASSTLEPDAASAASNAKIGVPLSVSTIDANCPF